jgi:hypothetical protein
MSGLPSPEQIKALFIEFDTDGNGVISKEEFRNALKRLGRDPSEVCIHKFVLDLIFVPSGKDQRLEGDLCRFSSNLFLMKFPDIMTERNRSILRAR